jgi:hypothetical protein
MTCALLSLNHLPPGGGHSQTLLLFVVLKKYHRFWDLDQTDIQPGGSLILGFWFGFCKSTGAAAAAACAWWGASVLLLFLVGGAGCAGGGGLRAEWAGSGFCFGLTSVDAALGGGGGGWLDTSLFKLALSNSTGSFELSSWCNDLVWLGRSSVLWWWRGFLDAFPANAASPSPSASTYSNSSSRGGVLVGVVELNLSGTFGPRFSANGLAKWIAAISEGLLTLVK